MGGHGKALLVGCPLWLASEKVDSVGLANNHLWERGMLDNEAWGRRDPRRTILR